MKKRIGYKVVLNKQDVTELEHLLVILEDEFGNREERKVEHYIVELAIDGEISEVDKVLDETIEALNDTAIKIRNNGKLFE